MRYRMYHFVIYQLNGRQAGIQASHARDEYPELHDDPNYLSWRKSEKTVIVLDGGTTNSQGFDYYSKKPYKGSMQIHMETLQEKGIKFAPFFEPNLNNAMTGLAFLLDERVWDRETYPDMPPSPNLFSGTGVPVPRKEAQIAANTNVYGEEVAWLRDWIFSQKLATN